MNNFLSSRDWIRLSHCVLLAFCAPAAGLTVTPGTALSFGGLVPGNSAGTVVVSPAGVRAVGGGVIVFSQNLPGLPAVSAATFSVSGGMPDAVCTLDLPASTAVTKSSDNMLVTLPVTSKSSITLDPNGAATFTVGATLAVGAGQTTGSYGSVNFSVSVTCP